MDYRDYFGKNIPDPTKLINYGFAYDGERFILKRDLKQSGLYAVIEISADRIDVRVIDRAFEDDFLPFGIKASSCPEKYEVECILNDIVEACCVRRDIRSELIQYLFEKYGTVQEYPWKTFPDYCTFKTANSKKWYAVMMDIRQSHIGLNGDHVVDVVNIKAASEKIPLLIDHVHYFPAYHMSKKTWITILLDRDTNLDEVKSLIDESYHLAEKHNGK